MAHSSTEKKTILILGGSYAGLSTAHYLLKHALPSIHDTHNIVIVGASSQALCRPACPRALISDDFFDQSKLFVDIEAQFKQYPRDQWMFIQGHASKLDHIARRVTVDLVPASRGTQTIKYHALIIATGASTTSPLLGFTRDEAYLRSSWDAFRQALAHASRIVIAGGGPTAIETAGELGEHLNGRPSILSDRASKKPKVRITVLSASRTAILPNLRPALARKAEAYLAALGVTVRKGTRVVSVSPPDAGVSAAHLANRTTLTLEDGELVDADLYIPATGTSPNTGFVDATLLAPDGRVETNKQTLRVDKGGPRVYAVGDCASAARPAVHLVLAAIPVLCANIKRDLLLDEDRQTPLIPERVFEEDTRETQFVPVGRSKGVGAAMGWAVPSWLVWLIKGRDYWLWTTGRLWSGKQWVKEK